MGKEWKEVLKINKELELLEGKIEKYLKELAYE